MFRSKVPDSVIGPIQEASAGNIRKALVLFVCLCLCLPGCSRTSRLVKQLQDPDAAVRAQAAVSLGQTKDRRAVEPLLTALKDSHPNVRASAATALGALNDARAVEPLIQAMTDANPVVRAEAAMALGEIKEPRAVGVWIGVLRRNPHGLEGRLGPLGNLGAPAVGPLLALLKDSNAAVRMRAAEALGETADRRAVEPLVQALRDHDALVRIEAAWALGKIKDPRAIEPLLTAWKNDPNLRWRAGGALGRIGAPAVEPLIALLRDGNPDVRSRAAEELAETGDPQAVEPLLSALRDGNGNVRMSAAMALGETPDPRAAQVLTDALESKNLEVTAGAHAFFIRRGQRGTESLLIKALYRYCNRRMAKTYLLSGNRGLEAAAAVCGEKLGLGLNLNPKGVEKNPGPSARWALGER